MIHFFEQINIFFGWFGYSAIIFLMALESSIFPVPSEAVMIPAWYKVSTWDLSFLLTILAWTLGSLIGAIANYFILGQLLGKPFLLKYGKYILIKESDYHKTEKLFLKNDKLYTFLGRLIPVVRHLISIPAGIFKMNFGYFVIITSIGASLWCLVLVAFGYFFWNDIIDLVEKYTKIAWIIAIIWVGIYLYLKIFKRKIKKPLTKKQ